LYNGKKGGVGMSVTHVAGENKGTIFIYALSTCGWCKKTKEFLKELGLEYSYVDVDLLPESEEDKTVEEMKTWNPTSSFPTIVINNKKAVIGFQPDKIKELLGI